jgi:hypothetical protein
VVLQRGRDYGVPMNADEDTVVSLYWTKEEANEEMTRLKAGHSYQAGYRYSNYKQWMAEAELQPVE